MKAWEYRNISFSDRVWMHVVHNAFTNCDIFTGSKDSYGYGQIKNKSKNVLVHRWVLENAKGPIPRGMCVLHSCDTPACVNVEHLRLGTHAENMTDKKMRHRAVGINSGAKHTRPMAKLTESNVISIKVGLASGKSQIELAKRFLVSKTTISNVCLEKTWRHLNIHVCNYGS
tara:strand:- start:34 stop:549 length:516 start_codon:yes stop_codon:yes gene_type:complete